MRAAPDVRRPAPSAGHTTISGFGRGLQDHRPLIALRHALRTRERRATLRHFSKTFEESIEMLGNSLLWYVFFRRLGTSAREVRIRFTNAVT